MTWILHNCDCLDGLRELSDNSVQCCVTSPPYWRLRDYGVDGQIGLEQSPEEYVARLADLFREVRRVLREDGTLWLNLGDSYMATKTGGLSDKPSLMTGGRNTQAAATKRPGLKPKDLVGIPWRVAFALQADGWYLRADCIWHKPNAMPESVTDRPTKAHEYLFLLTKAERYFYDADAIKEPSIDPPGTHRGGSLYRAALGQKGNPYVSAYNHGGGVQSLLSTGKRNRRTVWTVATTPFREAHFAVFPPKLIEPCILAGSRSGDLILDPFAGAGTTLLVAERLGRNSIGFELNPDYCEIARKRLA